MQVMALKRSANAPASRRGPINPLPRTSHSDRNDIELSRLAYHLRLFSAAEGKAACVLLGGIAIGEELCGLRSA